MTKFIHNPLQSLKLIREDLSTGRVYLTPEGNSYPSVTRILSFEPNPGIEEWKARVGEAEASAISNRAKARGTLIHAYTEDHLNNKIPNISMFDVDMWKGFKPVLDHINNIRMLEGKLYSDRLRLAGTVDCIAEYDGVLSIIDFKTSGRIKSEEDILSYFLQTTAYACMAYERYDLQIKQIVILIAVDGEEPQIFKKKVGDYLKPLYDIISRYRQHVRTIQHG